MPIRGDNQRWVEMAQDHVEQNVLVLAYCSSDPTVRNEASFERGVILHFKKIWYNIIFLFQLW